MVRDIIKADGLPDYTIEEEPGDVIRFAPRRVIEEGGPMVSADALDEARRLSPGADIYALEAQWRAWWVSTGRPKLRSPDRAFLGWVMKQKD